jgi:transglutaminase-like putative cysteine protease
MLIRFGYELAFTCAEPALMVCLLDAHRDHARNIRFETPFETTPAISTETYVDTFGNSVRRFIAPAGDLTICRDAIIEDSGRPDPVKLDAEEIALERLPNDTLIFMLGSRYCETDKLCDVAWQLFGSTPRGWRRVQAISDFVASHLTFGYHHARATRTAFEAYLERVGVCRDFAHLAVAFCRCMNVPACYVNGFLGDIGVPPDPAPMDYNAWFEVFLDGAGSPSMPATICHASDALRSRAAATQPIGPHTLKTFNVWTDEVEPAVLAGLTRRIA